MFVTIKTLITVLVATFMVTACGKGKNDSALPAQSIKKSPKRKNLTDVHIKQEDMSQKCRLGYHLKIIKLKPDFELIWIDAAPGNDGYAQDLFNHITNENGFRELGLLMVARGHIDQSNNNKLKNTRNNYACRCIVRALESESTHESRLIILCSFQAFLMRPEYNKFGYAYTVGEESNLTPQDEADFQAMDHFIQDDTIVNLMCTIFDDTDTNWYGQNQECALEFFSGPVFPVYAIEQLGYPSNRLNINGFAAGFNLPVESGS